MITAKQLDEFITVEERSCAYFFLSISYSIYVVAKIKYVQKVYEHFLSIAFALL